MIDRTGSGIDGDKSVVRAARATGITASTTKDATGIILQRIKPSPQDCNDTNYSKAHRRSSHFIYLIPCPRQFSGASERRGQLEQRFPEDLKDFYRTTGPQVSDNNIEPSHGPDTMLAAQSICKGKG